MNNACVTISKAQVIIMQTRKAINIGEEAKTLVAALTLRGEPAITIERYQQKLSAMNLDRLKVMRTCSVLLNRTVLLIELGSLYLPPCYPQTLLLLINIHCNGRFIVCWSRAYIPPTILIKGYFRAQPMCFR